MTDKIILQDIYLQPEGRNGNGHFDRELSMMLKVRFLEKKKDMVVLTKEEFEKAIGDAFSAGCLWKGNEDFKYIKNPSRDKTEYINNLFK